MKLLQSRQFADCRRDRTCGMEVIDDKRQVCLMNLEGDNRSVAVRSIWYNCSVLGSNVFGSQVWAGCGLLVPWTSLTINSRDKKIRNEEIGTNNNIRPTRRCRSMAWSRLTLNNGPRRSIRCCQHDRLSRHDERTSRYKIVAPNESRDTVAVLLDANQKQIVEGRPPVRLLLGRFSTATRPPPPTLTPCHFASGRDMPQPCLSFHPVFFVTLNNRLFGGPFIA